MELLREKGLDDVLVVVGGIIPDVDIPKLQEIGVKGSSCPGRRCRRSSTSSRPTSGRAWSTYSTRMSHKLLLADDSVTIQRVIELTFADEDVQVAVVGDGKQAIERTRRRSARHRARRRRHAGAGRLRGRGVHQERSAVRQHSGAAADRRVRAGRRGARAAGRLRRRAGEAVRAAGRDQPRQGAARGPAPGRAGRELGAGRRGARPRHRRQARCRALAPPTGAGRAAATRATRSRTTSIGSMPRSPTSAPRRAPIASSERLEDLVVRHRRAAPAAAAADTGWPRTR